MEARILIPKTIHYGKPGGYNWENGFIFSEDWRSSPPLGKPHKTRRQRQEFQEEAIKMFHSLTDESFDKKCSEVARRMGISKSTMRKVLEALIPQDVETRSERRLKIYRAALAEYHKLSDMSFNRKCQKIADKLGFVVSTIRVALQEFQTTKAPAQPLS